MHISKWQRWDVSVPSSLFVDEEASGTCWYRAQAWLPVLYFIAAESLSTMSLKRAIYLAYSFLSSFQEFVIWGRIHTCSKTFSSFVSWKSLVPPRKRPFFFFFFFKASKPKKQKICSVLWRPQSWRQGPVTETSSSQCLGASISPQPFSGGLCFGFLVMCLA